MMAFIDSITPRQYALALALFTIIGMLVWFQTQKRNTYDFLDILLDAKTARASLDAHVTLFFCVLAAWWIVTRTLDDEDVSGPLVQIIMIFVIYRAGKQAISAYADKPASPPDPPAQIDQQVNISRDPQPPVVAKPGGGKLPSAIKRGPTK